MTTSKPSRHALAVIALLLALTGCAGDPDQPSPTQSGAAASGELARVMSEHSLDEMDTIELIDHLDRLGGSDRPTELLASVRPDVLMLTAGDEQRSLEMPEDQFYLSFAPFVEQTHECFQHSLTTCQGELVAQDIQVEVRDRTNDAVLVDDTLTTFDNGFVGIWLPRDIEGTIRARYDGMSGEADFTTYEDAPTCLTTLRMV